MMELAVRMVVSLAVVVGLLLLCVRLAGKRFNGRSGSPLQVLHRQSLSRSSGVALVSVGGRMLLLGTTDQQVQMLTELDPAQVEAPTAATSAVPVTAPEPADSLLGSMARLVDEPTRWLPQGARRRGLADEAVAPAPQTDARPDARPSLVPVPEAPASFAATLQAELENELPPAPPAAAALRLSPAQVLLQEEQDHSPLTGSLLSPDTWRLAARAVTRRAS